MLQSTYTARSGLIAQQQRMDIIANNLSNIETSGYKSVRADFKDALYQTMVRPQQPQDGLNLQRGHGVLLAGTTRDFNQGTSKLTSMPLDVMISGDGFFMLQDPAGEETLYTRDGSFKISTQNGVNSLVTADGYAVLNDSGQAITLGSTLESDIGIAQDGTIIDTKTRAQLGKIGKKTFLNRAGLETVSNNRYRATVASGEAIESTATMQQGMLEASNVDVASEMVRMIRAQRAFSLAARALTTADEMDGRANTIRR